MLSAEIVLSPSVILLKLLHTTFCHFALFKFLFKCQEQDFQCSNKKIIFFKLRSSAQSVKSTHITIIFTVCTLTPNFIHKLQLWLIF